MTGALNAAIELHDSELGSIREADGVVTVLLIPAYVHRSAGRPGMDEGSGEVQDCELVFGTAHLSGSIGELPSVILKGELRIGNERHSNVIDLPCHAADDEVELTLFLYPDYRRLVVHGRKLAISLLGEAEYVEEFSPGAPSSRQSHRR